MVAQRTESHAETEGKLKFGLWMGLFGGPVAWLLQLQTAYSLVPWTCRHGKFFLIHVSSAVFLLLSAGAGLLAWRSWKATCSHVQESTKEGMDEVAPFMGYVGVAMSILFTLLIIAQALPTFVLSPCYE